jgi:LacI family transcriptional regulator
MPTIVDVAKLAEVSIATVSNVIRETARVSPKLRERVEKAIRDLEYHPNGVARSLKVKQTGMLGMVVPDITNPFFAGIIRGAEDKASERGYLLVTANTDEHIQRERNVISALRSRCMDGILLASAPGKDGSHIRSAMQAGIPIVSFDRATPGVKTDAVLLDNVHGSRECVCHMIDAGYREIAVITGSLNLQSARERLRGYKLAVKSRSFEVTSDLILEGDFRQESGYRICKELLNRKKRPTAIFSCNGVMALGALQALKEANVSCPEEIGLATFDDLAGDLFFHPRLTAVRQPSYDIGAHAATLLMNRVEGKLKGDPVVMRIKPTLVIRESTQRT